MYGGIVNKLYRVLYHFFISYISRPSTYNNMAYTQTIFPGHIPDGYFDADNIEFIRNKIGRLLKREFAQYINVDTASVKRVMQRVMEERPEPIVKMNQRVIMYITNDFRVHQEQARKHMNWEEHYIESQRLYDPTVERGPDLQSIKLANRLGNPRIGGTTRFIFI